VGSAGIGQPQQNSPVLTSALTNGGEIRIRGTLNTEGERGGSGGSWRVEFFSNDACDPSGYGEGQTFLGSTDVSIDEFCNSEYDVTLPVSVPVGQFITATATDLSTSAFSACVVAQDASRVEVVTPFVRLRSTATNTNVTNGPPLGPEGLVGIMTIRATFKNTSSTPIGTPFFAITGLTGGNVLLNADGGMAGVGGRLTPNVGADGVLSPGEPFVVEFDIGLWSLYRYTFFVDLWGEPDP
jgi:hypothetical protein